MQQHEEYQICNIYGIMGVKNYVSTSRKSTTCFIQDESELTEKFYEKKREKKLVYIMEVWN